MFFPTRQPAHIKKTIISPLFKLPPNNLFKDHFTEASRGELSFLFTRERKINFPHQTPSILNNIEKDAHLQKNNGFRLS